MAILGKEDEAECHNTRKKRGYPQASVQESESGVAQSPFMGDLGEKHHRDSQRQKEHYPAQDGGGRVQPGLLGLKEMAYYDHIGGSWKADGQGPYQSGQQHRGEGPDRNATQRECQGGLIIPRPAAMVSRLERQMATSTPVTPNPKLNAANPNNRRLPAWEEEGAGEYGEPLGSLQCALGHRHKDEHEYQQAGNEDRRGACCYANMIR